ncbi:MAG TPA: dephospho-CoA kinase [Pyrinomonadaceae bacterium]|jgi:dephospho-CoA kinase|nr:dephospho-CoA kinase [Pyrinomonadaceae bacterium]
MLKVGLTGSIAVGKTFVCQVLAELGCHVLDADNVARDVVKPSTSGWVEIREAFGVEVFQENGELDRKKMGAIVFADEEKRQMLNSIVHPLVIEEQNKWLAEKEAEDPDGVAVIDAALMIESGGSKRFDKLVVVWCRPEVQVERLIKRNFLSREEAQRRIATQMPQEEKKKYADYLIDTSESFEPSREQTESLFKQLKSLSV